METQRWIAEDGECWAIPCNNSATHFLKSRVLVARYEDSDTHEFVQEVAYCLDCAKHFAHWLVFAYTNEYEILDISPLETIND